MKTFLKSVLLALPGFMCLQLAYAVTPMKEVPEIIPDNQQTAELMVAKLHSEVLLTGEQTMQITELTLQYLQLRQAVMEEASDNETLSKAFISQLKEIEDQYQEGINDVLLPEQKEEQIEKQKENKNVSREEAKVAVQAAKQALIEQTQLDKNESSKK